MKFETLGVPLWRWPLQDESARGLLLHLTERNDYNSAESVASYLGIRGAALAAGDEASLRQFALMIRCPFDQMTASSPLRSSASQTAGPEKRKGKVANSAALTIRGVPVARSFLIAPGHRRVCAGCLLDSSHHRFWWDFRPISSCPTHGLLLDDRCGCGCNTPFSWRTARLFHCCACGSTNPQALPRRPASNEILNADRYLLGRFRALDPTNVPLLDAMGIYDVLDTTERLGSAMISGFSAAWQRADTVGVPVETARARGFSLIEQNKLPTLLDDLLSGFRKSSPSYVEPALTTAYGWLYHWFNFKGGKHFSSHLADEFLRHGAANFYIMATATAGADPTDLPLPLSYSLDAAARECGLARETMRKFGVSLGLIRAEAMTGRVLTFEGDKLRQIAKDMTEGANLAQTADHLGVDLGILRLLVAAEVLKPIFSGGGAKHQYVFRASDVDGLLAAILGGAPSMAQPDDTLVNSRYARRAYQLPAAAFFQAILDKRLHVVGRLATERGLWSALVDRNELRNSIASIAQKGEVVASLAATALHATSPAIAKLVTEGLLVGRREHGKLLIDPSSISKFRSRYIGLQEIIASTGGHGEATLAQLRRRKIRPDKTLAKCGFVGFQRRSAESMLPWLASLIGQRSRKAA
jgi:hypothetical protein